MIPTPDIQVGDIVRYMGRSDWVVEQIDDTLDIPLVCIRRGYGGFVAEKWIPIWQLRFVRKGAAAEHQTTEATG